MNELINKFEVGALVTFRTHPLLKDYEIRGDGKYVPPLMIVKEVLFEDKKKKTHDELNGHEIAERIKYICAYFDDNKSEFIEAHIYESMLQGIQDIKIGRIDDPERTNFTRVNLVEEILGYELKPSYGYGKLMYFKTLKLEVLKKRSSIQIRKDVPVEEGQDNTDGEIKKKKIMQYVVNYATPVFIVCGFKIEVYTDLFYSDGKPKRKAPTEFVKVKWFNPVQQKFSEQFLPMEYFTDKDPFPRKE